MDFIKNKPWITGVLVALLLVGGYLWLGRIKTTVGVTGDGSMVVPVDSVSLVVTAAGSGASAGDAIASGEANLLRLTDLTLNTMGKDAEINKSFYQVSPQSDGKFIMVSAMNIKSKSVSKTSDLIRLLFTNGANSISAVTFIPKDAANVEEKVRTEAIKDARVKAEVLAKVTGKNVGNLISISDDNGILGGSVNEKPGFYTNFETVKVEKKLTVVFEIQ